jgi:hypothetical protein
VGIPTIPRDRRLTLEHKKPTAKEALELLMSAYAVLCDSYDREELNEEDVQLKVDIACVLLRAGLLHTGEEL